MRKITHSAAIVVEAILRRLHYDCDRGGMCGLIDADYIENFPFDAILIAIAPYWRLVNDTKALSDFIYKWDEEFRKGGDGETSEKSEQFRAEMNRISDILLRTK